MILANVPWFTAATEKLTIRTIAIVTTFFKIFIFSFLCVLVKFDPNLPRNFKLFLIRLSLLRSELQSYRSPQLENSQDQKYELYILRRYCSVFSPDLKPHRALYPRHHTEFGTNSCPYLLYPPQK
ncbi:hypothetical protein LEP1GSC036_3288 [Leptospira weilii str. 2006001853]|uniref:Uncharacterized protein n=1 Tax=Leptospira weilii str. 2006001853 TaxID=1001589 RepID=A0A828Z353_9LEPT|nr:hypothetical protein LEP1GSC036_3288 [Leptospira weilii str. 2006001853]